MKHINISDHLWPISIPIFADFRKNFSQFRIIHSKYCSNTFYFCLGLIFSDQNHKNNNLREKKRNSSVSNTLFAWNYDWHLEGPFLTEKFVGASKFIIVWERISSRTKFYFLTGYFQKEMCYEATKIKIFVKREMKL